VKRPFLDGNNEYSLEGKVAHGVETGATIICRRLGSISEKQLRDYAYWHACMGFFIL